MANSTLDRLVRSWGWLDPLIKFLQAVVGGVYRVLGPLGRWLKDLAHGSRVLGHPLHPAVTDLPMGALTVTVALDVVAHYSSSVSRSAATVALVITAVTALVAVITGYTDFHETFDHEARVAVVHGLLMTVAYIGVLVALALRTLGGDSSHWIDTALPLGALLVMFLGGYVGGHLTFGLGTAVNRTAFLSGGSSKFVDVGALNDFVDGESTLADAKGLGVLVTRRGNDVCAIANVCSHAGGPLNEGDVKGNRVTCPWHASVFDVCTGKVIHGPATAAQPAFDVKVEEGRVSVKPRAPLH